MRTLREGRNDVLGLDVVDSPFTTHVGSVADLDFARRCMHGVDVVIHGATLHKPHVATHSRREFVETNVSGTLNLLEVALECGVGGFVYSSTTSVFGAAMNPGWERPAAWVNESLEPIPKNIYGVTKRAAEELCELFFRSKGLPCVVLRISRFFSEADDDPRLRRRYDDLNIKANEYLNRRVDLADVVDAHLLAAERVSDLGFARYVVSATTPFGREHLSSLRTDAPSVVRELYPDFEQAYDPRGWRMFPCLDRVYVNQLARDELGWRPRYDFRRILECLRRGEAMYSPLARAVGNKGYHPHGFEAGPYPVESDRGG